jgi:hypothetical protein
MKSQKFSRILLNTPTLETYEQSKVTHEKEGKLIKYP